MVATELLIKELQLRVIEEGIGRIRTCLSHLSDDEVWVAANANTNSVGNLILHLNGNVRQWLLQGVLDVDFTRERDEEFAKSSRVSKESLVALLLQLEQDINRYLFRLNEVSLNKEMIVQDFDVTVFSACIHVIEHFSYHVGQISQITKTLKNIDLGYYEDLDL